MYEAIKYANPKCHGLSDAGKSLLGGLRKNFGTALAKTGVEEIASSIFVDVNWDDVESESIIAPFYPSKLIKRLTIVKAL